MTFLSKTTARGTRRAFVARGFIYLFAAVSLIGVSSCGGDGGDGSARNIAVIPKSVGFDFWNTVHAGARQAGEELENVRIIWKGTHDETDIAGQVDLVESFINQGVDAIVIAAADSRGLVPVLNRARQAGIVVVTIDSNTEPQVSSSFVATNNREAAGLAADIIAEELNGSGAVALIPYIPGASTSNEREQGFKESLARHQGLRLVATQYSDSDYGKAMSVTEDILTAHPGLNAIFAANEPSVLGAAQAIRSRNVADQVVLVGFDASPRQIEGIRDGSIHALIVQNPFMMGYEGVRQAVRVLEGDEVEAQIDSGSEVVTLENLDEYLAD